MTDRTLAVRHGRWAAAVILILALGLAGSLAAGCSAPDALQDARIAACIWKAGESSPVGDVLDFRSPALDIRQGVIHRHGTSIADITAREARLFAHDIIVVRSIETGVTGRYYEKGCR